MASTYTYSISGDFPNQQVNPSKLKDEIEDSSITKTLSYINTKIPTNDDCVIVFEEDLTSGEKTTLDSLVAAHDGQPNPTPVDEFLDINADVTDPYTNISGPFLPMQVLENRRELFNDSENPLYIPSGFTPILGQGGILEDHAARIDNLDNIHGRTSWHEREIIEATYQKPLNLLIYYGWMNSFNSAINGWDNEEVAKDMAKYNLIVLGDGVQDPGHGDYSNAEVIIPRVKELNPRAMIFGYVTTNQSFANFQTKAGQWNDLAVHGIFMDESGYDFGRDRDEFNERVDYVHNQSDANICFANAWIMDHIIGTADDPSYPNSTYNPSLNESNLNEYDWFLLESFAIDTQGYSGNNGYEDKDQWFDRGETAIDHRYNYGINLAAVGKINDDNSSGQDLFDFGYVSALMRCLDAFGTSSNNYGSSTAQVNFWTRPNVKGAGRVWHEYPAVGNDLNDADVYWRFIDFADFMLDFSSGAESSDITIQEPTQSSGGGNDFTPQIYYAKSADTNTIGTSLGTLDWGTPDIQDDGYSEDSGVITIGSELDGKRVKIDVCIYVDGATGRCELYGEIQINTGGGYTAVKIFANYITRNATQSTGGISFSHYIDGVNTGDLIRVQASRTGSAVSKVVNGTSLSIETKN